MTGIPACPIRRRIVFTFSMCRARRGPSRRMSCQWAGSMFLDRLELQAGAFHLAPQLHQLLQRPKGRGIAGQPPPLVRARGLVIARRRRAGAKIVDEMGDDVGRAGLARELKVFARQHVTVKPGGRVFMAVAPLRRAPSRGARRRLAPPGGPGIRPSRHSCRKSPRDLQVPPESVLVANRVCHWSITSERKTRAFGFSVQVGPVHRGLGPPVRLLPEAPDLDTDHGGMAEGQDMESRGCSRPAAPRRRC